VQQGSFTLPQPNQETVTVLFDVLGDGRLITSDGSTIHIENSLGSRQFTQVEPFLRCPKFHARFTRHSGSPWRWKRVFVFDPSAISTYKTFAASNFDAEWVEDANLQLAV